MERRTELLSDNHILKFRSQTTEHDSLCSAALEGSEPAREELAQVINSHRAALGNLVQVIA